MQPTAQTLSSRMGLPARLYYLSRRVIKALKMFAVLAGPGIIGKLDTA